MIELMDYPSKRLKSFPRYLNEVEVIEYLGKRKVFEILLKDYGLKAIVKGHRGNLYSFKHVEEVCLQFENNMLI
jgi:hypothetical protein